MILSRFPLVLLLSSFVSAAAIPPSPHSISTSNPEPATLAVVPELSPQRDQAITNANNANPKNLAKRRPYYFPETVPDEEEIAARLAALREAGYLPDEPAQQGHDQKSIGTPDAAIDMNPNSARPSPIQEPPSALSGRAVPRLFWEDCLPGLIPAAWFFVFASVVVCFATVFRELSGKGKH